VAKLVKQFKEELYNMALLFMRLIRLT